MLTRRSCAACAALLASIAGGACAHAQAADASAAEEAALAAVARRNDARNAHDIDAFLAAHAEDVGIYRYPDFQLAAERAHLERIFGEAFARGEGSLEVRGQWVVGDTVVSDEYATGGDGVTEHIIVIYTIEDDVIASFRLIEPD